MKRFILSTYLMCALCVGNAAFALPITPMPYGGVVMINTPDCTATDFPAAEDTDVSRGQALLDAMTARQTGGEFETGISNQSTYLSAGTFDIGSTPIDLSQGGIRNILSNNNLHGSGKDLTTIQSAVHGPAAPTSVKPGMNSQITDLTIHSGSEGVADYAFPFGVGQETPQPGSFDFGTVFLKNVKLQSPTDGLYFWTNTLNMTLNVINVTVDSGWDAIAVIHGTGLVANIYNSNFVVSGVSSLTTTNYHGINDITGANFNIYNSIFQVQGKNAMYGIYTRGITNIFNTAFTMLPLSGFSSTPIDLFTHTGGTINVSPSVTYATSSGTITQIAEQTATVPTPPTEPCPNPFRSAPTVTVPTPASSITENSATLNATLSSDGLINTTALGFNYGLTTSYGFATSSTGTFSTGTTFSKTLTGLACGTTYTYQAFAINTEGTGTSTGQTFTTSACPVVQAQAPASVFSGGSSFSASELVRVSEVLAATSSTLAATTTTSFIFMRDLSYGMRGTDVRALQKYLNAHGSPVALSGSGSIGNETEFFGSLTKKALALFQYKNNIAPAVGYFGVKTRAFVSGNE